MNPEMLSLQLKEPGCEELVVIPKLEDFETLTAEDLAAKSDDVLILKHKLIMREGEHNGVYYDWAELKASYSTCEGAGLYYDHDDAASNWVGEVKNVTADDKSKSLFGDLHIVDSVAAKKLRYGAKWGVSPTIDAEKLVRDGKKYALDPKFISCSLVLRPAVRETMLNEDTAERRSKECIMEEKEKLREIEELATKKKLEDEKINAEKITAEKRTAEMKELESKVEKYETAELERKSKEVLESGVSFGILTAEDLGKLTELSDEGRAFISELIDRVATTLNLKDKDSKLSDEEKKEKLEKEAELQKEKEKSEYKKLGPQERMKQELSEEKAGNDALNKHMLAYMHKQEER